jgi:hypothetical protein
VATGDHWNLLIARERETINLVRLIDSSFRARAAITTKIQRATNLSASVFSWLQ